ncbi:hypothetical protein NQ314_005609 [Rhamnusium bicolor]|uniref:Uncharacterized protein n=1 Tax=Rhamnusium bicolor TaxID=1586634 RepID=A0AAV8ZGG8_9CUCU|nr:hypothetical protein NQ314_005609 [Rhamnusium bicolor]
MRPDKISYAAKCDPLICLYGESYLQKHRRSQMNVVVSNKMREMARLKIALQNSTTINTLIDVLKPELYKYIGAATKIVSGYNSYRKTCKSSSLAIHMGTNLKFLSDVARKAFITKDSLFNLKDRDKNIKNISELREPIANHWCNDISSLANNTLNEKKWEKPKLVSLTKDIQIFQNYVNKMADEAYSNLNRRECIPDNIKF